MRGTEHAENPEPLPSLSASSGPVFVACDMGTTLIKAAVIDLSGTILSIHAVDSVLIMPSAGVVEQDLLEIEASARTAIREAVAQSGRAADIAGVSFSSQMSGIGSVDADFAPAAPFDSWLDSRGSRDITEMAVHKNEVTRISGCPPSYSHGTKIRWMKRERPEEYARTVAFQVPGPFVAARAAGLPASEAFIDKTNLCFSNLSDTKNGVWSAHLCELFGVDIAKLPRIVDPLDVIGHVSAATAADTGIPEGTPIAAGGGDQLVACLGAGITQPGLASDSAGTASLLAFCLDTWAPDDLQHTLVTSQAIGSDNFIAFSFINGGGLGLEWLRKELVDPSLDSATAFGRLQERAMDIRPGSDGLLWLPHFQGGVLPPMPYRRSGWVGLMAGHTVAHLYRAILEGIALQYASWVAPVTEKTGEMLHEVRAMGGGSKSDLWLQIKADVLGIPFRRMADAECALLGNSLIAATATGHIDDLAAAAAALHSIGESIKPDPERHTFYRELSAIFDQLTVSVDPVFARLQEMASRSPASSRG